VKAASPTALRIARWICLSVIVIALARDYTSMVNEDTRQETRYRIQFLLEWQRTHPPASKQEPKVEVPNEKYPFGNL
jgi:hypothetical protein